MKIELDVEELKLNQLQINISHDDEVLYWNISSFNKIAFQSGYDVFKHINQYWAHLPTFKQGKIFSIFHKIKNVFEEVYDTSLLIHSLLPLMKDIFEEHKLEEIKQWMNFHSDILFPYKLDEVYVVSDEKPGSREKTYLKSDYYDLLTMAIALRVMIPIWGEFIYRTKRETGTLFKEFYAFKLLSQTNIIHSNPMEKLRIYVTNNIQTDKPILSSIINGVGTEDYPIWLLSKVLVSRLCVGDISGTNQSSSLVTFIWNYINHKVNNTNTGSYSGMIKSKEFENGDTRDDHSASRLEGYKIKTELPLGDVVILEHYMGDPINVALQLKSTINLELLKHFLDNASVLNTEQLWKPQVTLAQFILKPIMGPRGLIHLNKVQVISAIAIAQTILWESNHKVLACLISAVATDNESETMLSGIDSRARIPKDLMDELNVYYPFNKVSAQKKKGKVVNTVVGSIDELSQLFSQRDWILTVSDEHAFEVTGRENNRRFSCPHDIKILLAKLILELVKSR